MKALKQIIALIGAMILLFSLLALSACASRDSHEQRDVMAEIWVEGISEVSNVTVSVMNADTGEVIKLQAKKKDNFVCLRPMDHGSYVVREIETRDPDFEVAVLTTEFVIAESATEPIIIEAEETNIEGTLRWYWEKNAFTISAILFFSIALLVVRAKKKRVPLTTES